MDRYVDRSRDWNADKRASGTTISGRQVEGSGILSSTAKAFRAVTAVVVFGIPLAVGGSLLLGYGLHRIYSRLTGRS